MYVCTVVAPAGGLGDSGVVGVSPPAHRLHPFRLWVVRGRCGWGSVLGAWGKAVVLRSLVFARGFVWVVVRLCSFWSFVCFRSSFLGTLFVSVWLLVSFWLALVSLFACSRCLAIAVGW